MNNILESRTITKCPEYGGQQLVSYVDKDADFEFAELSVNPITERLLEIYDSQCIAAYHKWNLGAKHV